MGMDVMHVYGLTETYGHVSQCIPQSNWADLDASGEAEARARQGVAFQVQASDVVSVGEHLAAQHRRPRDR